MKSYMWTRASSSGWLGVVEQRFGHALMARAEEAKIGVAAGGEAMIDLNEIEEDLQIAFDDARDRAAGRHRAA